MKLKIQVPSDMSEIKLSQYQKFLEISEKHKEDTRFINESLVAIFCNLPNTVVSKLRAKDFENIVAKVTDVLSQKPDFQMQVRVGGQLYGFIPNLEDITIGEQADAETFIKDWGTMHQAMNVLYRPVTNNRKDTYEIKEYEGDGKGLDLPLDVVIGAMGFFLTLFSDLLKTTLNYTEVAVEQETKYKQILQENGLGTKTFTHLLTETYSSLTKLVGYDYTKDCFTYHLKPILIKQKQV